MGNQTSTGMSSVYGGIKSIHDEAYQRIEEAITLEEQERPNDAIEKYKEGVLLIDKGLNVSITFPENPDSAWENLCKMIQKMKKTRGEVLTRINCIQSSPTFIPTIPPPTYEEAMANEPMPQTYNDLAAALNNLQLDEYNGNPEIIYMHDGVRLYFISPGGEVISTSEPETLYICLIEEEENQIPKAFLQIGDWVYPLVPGVSPCYRTDYGAFILPDLHAKEAGFCIGIILPSDADAAVFELLENILHGIVSQSTQEHKRIRREPSVSGTISNGIINGANFLSTGLITGARKAGDLINYGTPKIINSMNPIPENTEVPPQLRKTFKFAQTATTKAANVTGFVADKVGLATTRLGQYLAPHIRKQGTRLLTSGFQLSEEEASSKVNGVLTVAAGAIEGFATVYKGLEASANILGRNLQDNSVKIIQHKYGSPVGELANDTMSTVGNVWHISNNARLFTPKGIVKYTAKQTGRAIASDQGWASENAGERTRRDIEQPSTSYPPLIADNFKEDTEHISSTSLCKKE